MTPVADATPRPVAISAAAAYADADDHRRPLLGHAMAAAVARERRLVLDALRRGGPADFDALAAAAGSRVGARYAVLQLAASGGVVIRTPGHLVGRSAVALARGARPGSAGTA